MTKEEYKQYKMVGYKGQPKMFLYNVWDYYTLELLEQDKTRKELGIILKRKGLQKSISLCFLNSARIVEMNEHKYSTRIIFVTQSTQIVTEDWKVMEVKPPSPRIIAIQQARLK